MHRDLPPEIVSEIASYLPYRDVVALQKALSQTGLCATVNTHVVWLNLATQYVAEHPHSQLTNTPCLSSLTTDQLRLRFEKRLLVNEIWQLPREVYPLVKRLKYPSSKILTVKIAPGGRWVFGGTHNLKVCYWDLDSDNPEPFVLVPRDGVGNIPGRHCSVVEIDFAVEEHGDPLSGFTIAFVGCDYHLDYNGKSREWLYIWDVKVQEDSTLEAKHLKALPMPYPGSHPHLSFNEHLAARYLQYESYRLDVYWWKDCTQTHLTRCTIEIQRGSFVTNIFVLGRDKILVYTKYQQIHKVRLYAVEPAYSEIGECRKVLPTATEVWSLRFLCDYNLSEISKLYFDGTNYSQTIAMLDGIFRLTIPACQADEPTLAKVSDFDLYHRQHEGRLYGLGLNKGYCKTGQTLYRFGYSKGPTMEVYESGAKLDPDLDRILQRLDIFQSFDEESGRLVSICMNHLVFQDFSLPLYNAIDACPSPDPSLEKNVLSWWYGK